MNALAWTLPLAAVLLVSPLTPAAADAAYSPPSGSLTGIVTDAATGAPLANDCDLTITAHYADGWNYAVKQFTGCLDAAGQYTIVGLPTDRYRVEITDASGTYFDQYVQGPNHYAGDSSRSDSAVLAVTNGQASNVDIPLVRSGSITGLITGAATGQPMANDCDLQLTVGWAHGSATGPGYTVGCTDANGQFTIADVEPGDYGYGLWQPGYVAQSGELTVTPGQQAHVDAAFVVGAQLRVVFRSSTDNEPLSGARYAVVAIPDPAHPNNVWIAGTIASTSRYGVVALHDVEPGSYAMKVTFEGGATYRRCTWKRVGPEPSVTLTSGQTTTVTVHFAPGACRKASPPPPPPAPTPAPAPQPSGSTGRISGVIRDQQTGLALAGVCSMSVEVGIRFRYPTNSAEAGLITPVKTWTGCLNSSGRYRIRGIPATTGPHSTYTVYVVDNAKRYGSRYLGDTPSSYHATFVTVTADQTTSADVTIPELATVSGTLYDVNTGAPLSNFCGMTVRVSTADPATLCTDANGGYTITGVRTGNYISEEFAPASGYESHYWMADELFGLNAGEHRTGMDAYLVPLPGA